MTIEDEQIEWGDSICRCQIDDQDSLSEAVIYTVNKCLKQENREISILKQTPLYECIDPDALDALFPPHSQSAGEVSFEYEGYHVTVTSDREVAVRTIESPSKW